MVDRICVGCRIYPCECNLLMHRKSVIRVWRADSPIGVIAETPKPDSLMCGKGSRINMRFAKHKRFRINGLRVK